jgi:VWFA-related protein
MGRRLLRVSPFVLICCSFLFHSQVWAQDAGKSAVPAVAKFTSRTQLVMIPVVVTGKNGAHIGGLTRDAFRIEERGKVREASIFEEVNSVAPDVKARAAAPGEGQHSNFNFGDTGNWRVTVVVMDMLNTPFLNQEEAKRKLMQYLEKNLRREEPTALLGLKRSGLQQLYPFTSDAGVLIAALKKLQGETSSVEMIDASPELTGDMTDSLDNNSVSQSAAMLSQFMQDSETSQQAYEQRNATRTTLEALTQIAHAYEAIPGRKTLIWASGGFPFMIDDPQSFAHMGLDMVAQYEETWRALSAAGIAVYTLDVRGLVGFSGITAGLDSSRRRMTGKGSSGMTTNTAPHLAYDKDAQQQQTLRTFAEATGGIACVNTNDQERCFAHAVDDSRSYYMLGYYLRSDDQQPGWRKLKVKVDVEGAHVRAREGFYVGAAKEDTPQTMRQQMSVALRSPVEFTGIRMNVREIAPGKERQAAEAGKTRRQFAVGMPAKSVTVDVQNGNQVDMTIVAIAFDSKGKNAGQGENHVAGKLKSETAEKVKRGGMGVEVGVELAPGKYDMHIAARDNLNGEVGTVVFPVEVK